MEQVNLHDVSPIYPFLPRRRIKQDVSTRGFKLWGGFTLEAADPGPPGNLLVSELGCTP